MRPDLKYMFSKKLQIVQNQKPFFGHMMICYIKGCTGSKVKDFF